MGTAHNKLWLTTRDFRLRMLLKKLSPKYIGLYTIAAQVNPVSYRLLLPPHLCVYPAFYASLLKLVIPGMVQDKTTEPTLLPAIEVEGTPTCRVGWLLDSMVRCRQLQYLAARP